MNKVTVNSTKCPSCGNSWLGESMLDTFKRMRDEGNSFYKNKTDAEIKEIISNSYHPPYRWGRQIGIELAYPHSKHYDGISYIQCPDCKATFNIFTGLQEEIPTT